MAKIAKKTKRYTSSEAIRAATLSILRSGAAVLNTQCR